MLKSFIFLCCLAFAGFAYAQNADGQMSFSDTDLALQSRLWLPCSFGQCMIDLGGHGSLIRAVENDTTVEKIKTIEIVTLQGNKNCDEIKLGQVILAGKTFSDRKFLLCDWLLPANSPMLGLDYFYNQMFEMDFIHNQFQWLDSFEKNEQTVSLNWVVGWPLFNGQLGSENVMMMLDTGCPLTIVDQDFFDQHQNLFDQSSLDNGQVDLLEPLIVGGVRFEPQKVLIKALKKTFGSTAPQIMIGMSHLVLAKWQVDMLNKQMNVFAN